MIWDNESMKDEWRIWGNYMASERNGYPSTNILARIRREGFGARHLTRKDFLPAEGCPRAQVWVHRCWHKMPETMSNVMLVHFASDAPGKEKARALRMGQTAMYAMVSDGFDFARKYWAEQESQSACENT